jgi:hypothetical protein
VLRFNAPQLPGREIEGAANVGRLITGGQASANLNVSLHELLAQATRNVDELPAKVLMRARRGMAGGRARDLGIYALLDERGLSDLSQLAQYLGKRLESLGRPAHRAITGGGNIAGGARRA